MTSLPPCSLYLSGCTVRIVEGQILAGDEQTAIRQPVDRPAHCCAPGCHDLGLAQEVYGHHLAGTPVGEPQPAVVPTPRLDHHEAVGKQTRGGKHLCHDTDTVKARLVAPDRTPRHLAPAAKRQSHRHAAGAAGSACLPLRRGFGGARWRSLGSSRWSQHRLNQRRQIQANCNRAPSAIRGFHTSGAPRVRSHLAAGPGQESRSALGATPLA